MDILKKQYQKTYLEFEKALKLISRISNQTINIECDKSTDISSWIYTKIIAHTYSINKLLPKNPIMGNQKNELWDLSSIATIVRSIMESYYVLYYIGIDQVTIEEKEFRLLLFNFNSEINRFQMLKFNNCQSDEMKVLEQEVTTLKNSIITHSFFQSLKKTDQDNIKDGKKAILLTNSEISKRAKISINYHKLVYKHLSNYTHTLPFAINQLSIYRAENKQAFNDMKLMIEYSLVYLSLSTIDFLNIIPININLSKEEKNLIHIYSSFVK